MIFGDGAGAVVLNRENDLKKGIMSTHLYSQGKFAKELSVIWTKQKNGFTKFLGLQ